MRKTGIKRQENLKVLSVAAIAGAVILGAPAFADESNSNSVILSGSEESQIPGNIPTLGENSAYTVTAGTAEDYTFIYKTADEDGNITDSYYKIELKSPPLEGGETGEGVSPSSHVTWQEVSAPTEGADMPANTIQVNLPDNVTKYYQYEYNQPSDYTTSTTRINNTLLTSNVDKVVFEGITGTTNGGVIYNFKDASTVDIVADFVGNSAENISGTLYGGVIYSAANTKLGDITGDFIGNYINAGSANGGAIFASSSTFGKITSNFIGNYTSSTSLSQGGAISCTNNSTISSITGDFIGNYSSSSKGNALGGAIVVSKSTIGDITGDFIGNYVSSSSSNTQGGALQTLASFIGNITGDFIGNYINSGSSAYGGAIYSSANSTIGDITGDFIGNYINAGSASGGAIFASSSTFGKITSNFIGNYTSSTSSSEGGAISCTNNSTISSITGDFIGNYIDASNYAQGGGIFNATKSIIGDITGDFIGNYLNASNYAQGGAIFNAGDSIGDITGSFINNYAKTLSDSFYALGGAVFTNNNMQFNADGNDEKTAVSLFSGNYTSDSRGVIPNAIFVRTNAETAVKEDVILNDGTVKNLTTGYSSEDITPEITMNAVNSGAIIFNDQIDGAAIHTIMEVDKDTGTSTTVAQTLTREHQYDLHLTGDESSNIVFNNSVINANITMDSTNVTIRDAQDFNFAKGDGINSLTINSGNLNFLTMGSQALNLQALNLNGGTINIANSDLDLQTGTMGRLSANSYGADAQTSINVQNLTVAKDMKNGVNDVTLAFADKSFAQNVTYTGSKDLYSKILKYHTWYDSASGKFNVRRIGGVAGYNPAILASSVAAQAGAYVAQTESFNHAFSHADGFMNNSSRARFALQTGNNYALQDNNLFYSNNETTDKSIWVQPYASFESINLHNGPKVNTTSYGTFVGGNSPLKPLNNGWSTVTTAYAGYNGSSQSYNGINTYQNGGMLGATQTWYKGNFYTALTANVGASVGEAHTPYGHDDFTMLMAGIASKTGYNLEFKEGRYIIQPSMLVGYSFINTFDYTSAAGVRIKHDPMNSIQLRPNMKFIANLKNGWQPYASVGVVWNILNDTKVTAEDITLPEMSIKPYVEYGVGVQKRWKDKFTGYAQAMLRNGGRNGIALTAGFRWALGSEGKAIQKVQNDTMEIPSTFGRGWHEVSGEGLNPISNTQRAFATAQDDQTNTLAQRERMGQQPSTSHKLNIMTQQDILARANGYTNSIGEKKIVKQLTPTQKTALGKHQNTTRTTAVGQLKQL